MSVLGVNNYGWIICHESFVKNIYSRKTKGEMSFEFNPVLFDVLIPFKKSKQKTDDWNLEIKLVAEAYKSLRDLFYARKPYFEIEKKSNFGAKVIANNFYNESFQYPDNSFFGGNTNENVVISTVEGEKYLFPEKCVFYSQDIKDISHHLGNQSFDFILMDPPWWNKFIRRKRKANANSGYTMLYDNDLVNIPINNLLKEDGIVGVWCTSAPSHINSVLTILFPAWNIHYVSQWFWLKVTKFGELICSFSQYLGKQPYERIIFGVKKNSVRKCQNPENNKVFMSVPSAIHSHKPPICEIIKPYLPDNSVCLELFARYLLPQWTSYGNEVLKLQHLSLYNQICETSEQSTS